MIRRLANPWISTTIWGEVGINLSDRLRLTLEGFNLFDSAAADIDYFYV